MKNQTIPINSSRIKTCEYENCKNQFIRRSNNHKVSYICNNLNYF